MALLVAALVTFPAVRTVSGCVSEYEQFVCVHIFKSQVRELLLHVCTCVCAHNSRIHEVYTDMTSLSTGGK